MPLEMVDDPQDQQDNSNDNSGGGSGGGGFGGGGGLLGFLPMILGMMGGRGGRGGILILLLLVGGGYFLLKKTSCTNTSAIAGLFSQSGYHFDANQFKKASVYEGLEDDKGKNPLPEAVSLAKFAPDRGDQKTQGSCVAWSSAYAARTILQAAATRQDPNQLAFSPAFLYNNIAQDGCQGSFIQKAMEFMQKTGALPLQQFPYDPSDCSRQASGSLMDQAGQFKIHGFTRLTESDDVNGINIRAIKEHLAKDAPVVIGMLVGGTFMQDMMGQKVWHPTGDDNTQAGFGGHAMCIVGYDDRVEGGAFQVMNSWGNQWGENGFAFIRYRDFSNFVREAYGIDPLPKQGAALNIAFECSVGLMNNETKQYIPLHAGNGNIFTTNKPVTKGTKFKIEIKNALECYIYLFTPKADGTSFVLFPYKPIHSSYCGITGYRLFPRAESIRADSIGNQDFMGIVVSKQALDYNALNDAINKSGASSYAEKLNEAIAANAITNVNFSASGNGMINFKAGVSDQKNVVGCVVEIDKQ